MITRRDALLAGLFGAGHIGLRALATGLPAWFLMNPRRATAQALQCAIKAKDEAAVPDRQRVQQRRSAELQLSRAPTRRRDDRPPAQPEVGRRRCTLGGKTYGAALPWAERR